MNLYGESCIQRARDYYQKAKEGIPMLAPDARFAVQVRTCPTSSIFSH